MIGTTVAVEEDATAAGMAAGTADAAGLAATSPDNDDDDDEETDDAGKVCAFNCHFSVGTAW